MKQGGFGITSVSLRLLEDIKDILLRLGELPYIFSLYKSGYKKSFGYDVRDCYCIRWTPNSKKSKNFIENGIYHQLIKSVSDNDYRGEVITCEVENIHKYNVMGIECCNSQYYNNPNAAGSEVIPRDKFQYYDRKYLTQEGGSWYFKGNKLNVFAAVDFAFSLKKKADFTALVVVGIDSDNNYYVLEIDRFKTDRIKEYYDHILNAHIKWGFRMIRAEVTIAQQAIVSEIRENYIKPQGLALAIDEYRPTRHDGDKAERIEAILAPRYDNLQIWHYNGGNTQILEEELVMQHPPHDDVKESLSNAVAICKAPKKSHGTATVTNIIYHSRFGGVSN